MPGVLFRFNGARHEYVALDTGEVLPHITGMLTRTGWVDDLWFTEESSERGTAVHQLTAEYDLGALDVASCVTRHRAYLLAHVAAMEILRPEILAVEEPLVHSVHRFGGRPDRLVKLYGAKGPFEIKAAVPAKSHPIQTALQAILAEEELQLPAEKQVRHCLYLKPNGKFKLEEHRDPADFEVARQIIRACCIR